MRIPEYFSHIFRLESRSLLRYLEDVLKKFFGPNNIEKGKDFIYCRGELPVLLVAHVDTVHPAPPRQFCYANGRLFSPQGLGADDRAGVFAIAEIISNGYRPHVLFTDKEETGALGAIEASEKLNPAVNLVIELDRRGKDDFVTYQCCNPELDRIFEAVGYKKKRGIFTDISVLCPAWQIGGANVSVGYYNAHTKEEYLKLDELYISISRVKKILQNPPQQKIEYIRDNTFQDVYFRETDPAGIYFVFEETAFGRDGGEIFRLLDELDEDELDEIEEL